MWSRKTETEEIWRELENRKRGSAFLNLIVLGTLTHFRKLDVGCELFKTAPHNLFVVVDFGRHLLAYLEVTFDMFTRFCMAVDVGW